MSRTFPGSIGNYISCGDVNDITTDMVTISAWVYLNATTRGSMVSKRDANGNDMAYCLQLDNVGPKFSFLTANGTTTFNTTDGTLIPLINKWYHVVGWKKLTGTNSQRVYVDGKLDGVSSPSHTIGDSAEPLLFGQTVNGANWNLNGRLAHIGIWDVALDPNEIVALSQGWSPVDIRPEGLRGYWPLNDYAGSGTARDRTIARNDATMIGAVGLSNDPPVFVSYPLVDDWGLPSQANIDAATIYVDMQVSSAEVADLVDSATVLVDLQTSGVDEKAIYDSATVYIDISNTGGECFSSFSGSYFGEEADLRWSSQVAARWSANESLRWLATVSVTSANDC